MNDYVILVNPSRTGSLADVEVHGPYGDHEDVERIADLYRENYPEAEVEAAAIRR
jgi:hypothetical protein